jgi:hypothetical protein
MVTVYDAGRSCTSYSSSHHANTNWDCRYSRGMMATMWWEHNPEEL